MSVLIHTLRLAVRSLMMARGLTVIAVVTLGIGLSGAVALMGMIDGGIRPLPVPDGARIVEIELRDARAALLDAPVPLTDWTAGDGIDGAGALRQFRATLVHPDAGALRLSGAAMHPSVLRLLRVAPALGRLPSGDDGDRDAMVVSWSVWEELGADPALLGTRWSVSGDEHTLIGVMPAGFGFPERQSFWTVLPPDDGGEVVARLTRDANVANVMAAVQSRANALAASRGGEHLPYSAAAVPWTVSRDSGGEGPLWLGLTVLCALLLLVCAANVSMLLLVRAEERASLLAVHAALGASRRRIAAQLFAEAALITLGGGILGLAGGFTLLRWMQLNLSQHWGYYWMTMEVRLPVVAGMFAAVMCTSVLAGTAPALRAMRVDIVRILISSSGSGHDPRRRHLGRWLVGAQVAMSTIGVVVAVYLAWGVGQRDRITERLPLERIAVAAVTLPSERYAASLQREALMEELRRELGRIPGVSAVSIGTALPGGPGAMAQLVLPGDERGVSTQRSVFWDAADDGLLATYGMRVVAGRPLRADDDANSAPVAVVTTGVALRHLGGNAVGKSIRLPGVHGADMWVEVVGVVENWSPDDDGSGHGRVIIPLAQAAPERLTLSVRAADPRAVLADMRIAVATVDGALPVEELQTLQARMDWFLRMWRVIAAFGVFGGVTSALVAAVGLFGVVSFQVRSRTREIGVRMAVGARASQIAVLFIGESLRRVLPGLVLGFSLALLVLPLVGTVVSGGNSSPDALLMTVVAGSMLVIGIAAALQPALRAARMEPQVVLRGQ